ALTLIDDDRSDLVLAKRTAQQLAGRVVRGAVVVPYEDAHWWHLSLFDEVYVTDGSQSGVRHLRRDAALARSQSKQLAAVLKRFRAAAPAVAERFRAAQPELSGREHWTRLVGAWAGPGDRDPDGPRPGDLRAGVEASAPAETAQPHPLAQARRVAALDEEEPAEARILLQQQPAHARLGHQVAAVAVGEEPFGRI